MINFDTSTCVSTVNEDLMDDDEGSDDETITNDKH